MRYPKFLYRQGELCSARVVRLERDVFDPLFETWRQEHNV